MFKSSGETAEANNLVTRSECKTASVDPIGGNPSVNFNFLTEEKYSTSIRRRYELQVSWLLEYFGMVPGIPVTHSILHSGSTFLKSVETAWKPQKLN
jgi:hypothetical protein